MTIKPALLGASLAFAFATGGAFAQSCGTITLGAAVSLTGKYASSGNDTKQGYEFAIKKMKEAGGFKIGDKCYNFDVKYYDDESKGDRGATLTERLIQQDGVKYMLGPYSSGLTTAIAPVTEKYKIPMVEAEGASRSLFNKGYKYLFAALSTSDLYLSSAIDLAAEMAKKQGKDPSSVKVAIAVENDPFSLDVRAGVVDEAKKYGMNVAIDEKLPRDLADMSAILTKVKLLKPDVLVVSGHEKGAALAIRQVAEQDIHVPMLALTHCETADVIGKFGKSAENVLCATQWAETLSYKDNLFGTAADFNKEVKSTIPEYKDREVPYQLAQASAAVEIYANAFARAGSLDNQKVRDALATTDMNTFYGPIKFSPEGNNVGKPMVLRQIQNGKYVVVAPTAFAAAPLIWPRP